MQGVSEGVRGVVREEVEAALQRHAHTVNPEAQAQEERARRQVSPHHQCLESSGLMKQYEPCLHSTATQIELLYVTVSMRVYRPQ